MTPNSTTSLDLICLSHLRWDFVYQRPQHLMSRFARGRRVFFWEEPVWHDGPPEVALRQEDENLWVAVPHLPHGMEGSEVDATLAALLDGLREAQGIERFVLWYYTPMALAFTRDLDPEVTVYDCMDELSLFKDAPSFLTEWEAELMRRADLVFTGGPSLYESKRERHPHAHCFPSSIDAEHFAQARAPQPEPDDQAGIPQPRLGFFGVIDERMDLELVRGVAEARPDWQLVIVGPVVKIDPATLPQNANIHYLGMKRYNELPRYLAGWDAALMPFAHNDSTRFISPTKTPEYLAGGVPVVSTSVRDVVRLYGEGGLVQVADGVPAFVEAIERALAQRDDPAWRQAVDEQLAQSSWAQTWEQMDRLIEAVQPRVASPL